MEQSLNRIWNPLSAELSIQGQRKEGSLSNPLGTTLSPAVKLPLLYYSFPDMQALYQASLSHTATIYCPYQSMKPFLHSVRLEHQKRKPKKCANILPQKNGTRTNCSIEGKPSPKKSAVFFNIVQKAFDPPRGPPPLVSFEYVVNFSEGILTKVRKRLSQQLLTK